MYSRMNALFVFVFVFCFVSVFVLFFILFLILLCFAARCFRADRTARALMPRSSAVCEVRVSVSCVSA